MAWFWKHCALRAVRQLLWRKFRFVLSIIRFHMQLCAKFKRFNNSIMKTFFFSTEPRIFSFNVITPHLFCLIIHQRLFDYVNFTATGWPWCWCWSSCARIFRKCCRTHRLRCLKRKSKDTCKWCYEVVHWLQSKTLTYLPMVLQHVDAPFLPHPNTPWMYRNCNPSFYGRTSFKAVEHHCICICCRIFSYKCLLISRCWLLSSMRYYASWLEACKSADFCKRNT